MSQSAQNIVMEGSKPSALKADGALMVISTKECLPFSKELIFIGRSFQVITIWVTLFRDSLCCCPNHCYYLLQQLDTKLRNIMSLSKLHSHVSQKCLKQFGLTFFDILEVKKKDKTKNLLCK